MTESASQLQTDRLLLRRWKQEDRVPFFQLNSDPAVCEFLPKLLTREESDSFADRIEQHFDLHGFGLWAVEVPQVAPFIGFVGLSTPRFDAHFTPCTEIAWRLSADHWGQGYATEAATAALQYGFSKRNLTEIVSLTVPANVRSRRVMERIGMQRNPADDFDHPLLSAGHRLRRHVLYRSRRSPDDSIR